MECEDCGGTDVVENEDRGDLVCRGCGLVTDGYTRRAPPPPKPGGAPGSSAVSGPRAPAPRSRAPRFSRGTETQIRDMCGAAGLAAAEPVAQLIWSTARESPRYRVRKGDNSLGYTVAIIFHACKLVGVPRTPKELCRMFGARLSNMRRMVKDCQEAADRVESCDLYSFSAPAPPAILHRYLDELGLVPGERDRVRRAARELWARHGPALSHCETDSIVAGLLLHLLPREAARGVASVCSVCKNTAKHVRERILSLEGGNAPPADGRAVAPSGVGGE